MTNCLLKTMGFVNTLLLIFLAIYPKVVYFTYLELMDDLYPLGDYIIPQIDNSTNPCVCVYTRTEKRSSYFHFSATPLLLLHSPK